MAQNLDNENRTRKIVPNRTRDYGITKYPKKHDWKFGIWTREEAKSSQS